MNESGTGVPPVNPSEHHAQDGRATIKKRHGAYLPHWTRDDAWYAVTFRLWDSLPKHVVESWLFERTNIVKTAEQMKRPLSKHEEDRLRHLYSEKIERCLDAGFGSCFMKDQRIAREVSNALLHFEGRRYNLAAWCVMPNHVHAVVQPFARTRNTGGTPVPHTELPEILHSWKSYTAKESNKLLRRSGEFWQAEYYDHLIRDEADFFHAVKYVFGQSNQSRTHALEMGWRGQMWHGHLARDLSETSGYKNHGRDARATAPCGMLESTPCGEQWRCFWRRSFYSHQPSPNPLNSRNPGKTRK